MTDHRPVPIRDLSELLSGLDPILDPETYLWCTVPEPAPDGLHPVVTVAEDEGRTFVLTERSACDAGLAGEFPSCRITLRVLSALDAVGLTAAVAEALTRAGIPANVVAGFHHDHVFVPADRAQAAVTVLQDLARTADPGDRRAR